MLVFEERGINTKWKYSEKNLSVQGREPTHSTHTDDAESGNRIKTKNNKRLQKIFQLTNMGFFRC